LWADTNYGGKMKKFFLRGLNNFYELNIPGYIEVQQEKEAISIKKLDEIRARPENRGNIPIDKLIASRKHEDSVFKYSLFSPEEKQEIIKEGKKYDAKLNDLRWNFWITRILSIFTVVISITALIVSICKN
jgi:hypothetical protein